MKHFKNGPLSVRHLRSRISARYQRSSSAKVAPIVFRPGKQTGPLLISMLLLYGQTGHAEENTPTSDYFYQDFPVVLTASRLSQPLSEAPSAMTVINREMIRASGFRTIPDLMRLVPGMYVGFADANRPVVSLHGSSDEYAHRMQILIDGRSVYFPPFGGVNWADMPIMIEDIERIEVVRGPATSAYGTNSFYGVINIITRDAASQNGGSISVTEGDASDSSVRFGKAGEQFDYRISLGSRADRGIDDTRLNDHNETHIFNFRSNYHPNATDNIDVQLGRSFGVFGLGVAGRPEDAFRETISNSNFIQTSWVHVWPASNETKLTYSQSSRSYLDPYQCIDSAACQGNKLTATPPVSIAQGFTELPVYSQRKELEMQNTNQLNENNRLVWGAGLRRDYADYQLFLGQPHAVSPWQLFAHEEWRITSTTVLNIGTMYEDNGMGSRNNSPRASISHHFTPQHTMRIGVSTATRSPVMSEAFIAANNTIWGGAYVPPVTPLTPERVLSREIAYIGDFQSLGLTIDARMYIDQVSDLIWWDKYVTTGDPNSAPDSYKNLLSAEYKGFDATVTTGMMG
ncbi:MAG TPA: TonB-dependent receptor [Gallionellaceae bacterium]